MTRFVLILVTAAALSVTASAADLPTGTWAANVDGQKGEFVVTSVKDKKFTGSLLGTDVTGAWDGKTLTFEAGKDMYEAHLLSEPGDKGKTRWTLTGTRATAVRDFATRAGTVHVVKAGWYAQLTADAPVLGEITATVRGVLMYSKASAHVRVTRKVGDRIVETVVQLAPDDWKEWSATLAPLDGQEVVATGPLVAAVATRGSPTRELALVGKIEVKPAK